MLESMRKGKTGKIKEGQKTNMKRLPHLSITLKRKLLLYLIFDSFPKLSTPFIWLATLFQLYSTVNVHFVLYWCGQKPFTFHYVHHFSRTVIAHNSSKTLFDYSQIVFFHSIHQLCTLHFYTYMTFDEYVSCVRHILGVNLEVMCIALMASKPVTGGRHTQSRKQVSTETTD